MHQLKGGQDFSVRKTKNSTAPGYTLIMTATLDLEFLVKVVVVVSVENMQVSDVFFKHVNAKLCVSHNKMFDIFYYRLMDL